MTQSDVFICRLTIIYIYLSFCLLINLSFFVTHKFSDNYLEGAPPLQF